MLPEGVTEFLVILYLSIAIVGVLFLVLSAVLGEVFDFFGDADADGDVHPLSGNVIAVALTAFGTAGMITSLYDWDPFLGALTSLLSALLLGAVAWWMIGLLHSQTASTDLSMGSMQGRVAEVTVNIPEGSVGEVLIARTSGTHQMIARSRDGSAIRSGTSVRVVEARGSMLIVEPLNQQTVSIREPQKAEG